MSLSLPESWTDRLPFLAPLGEGWQPLARWAAAAWLVFYALFLIQLARGSGPFLMLDLVFVPVHEGGHLLFGYLGHALMIAGRNNFAAPRPISVRHFLLLSAADRRNGILSFLFFRAIFANRYLHGGRSRPRAAAHYGR